MVIFFHIYSRIHYEFPSWSLFLYIWKRNRNTTYFNVINAIKWVKIFQIAKLKLIWLWGYNCEASGVIYIGAPIHSDFSGSWNFYSKTFVFTIFSWGLFQTSYSLFISAGEIWENISRNRWDGLPHPTFHF